jgi:hypothetical protein
MFLKQKIGAWTKKFHTWMSTTSLWKEACFSTPPHPDPPSIKTNNKDRQILFIQHEREESERGSKKINLLWKKLFVVNKQLSDIFGDFAPFFMNISNKYKWQRNVEKSSQLELILDIIPTKEKAVWQNVK